MMDCLYWQEEQGEGEEEEVFDGHDCYDDDCDGCVSIVVDDGMFAVAVVVVVLAVNHKQLVVAESVGN